MFWTGFWSRGEEAKGDLRTDADFYALVYLPEVCNLLLVVRCYLVS